MNEEFFFEMIESFCRDMGEVIGKYILEINSRIPSLSRDEIISHVSMQMMIMALSMLKQTNFTEKDLRKFVSKVTNGSLRKLKEKQEDL